MKQLLLFSSLLLISSLSFASPETEIKSIKVLELPFNPEGETPVPLPGLGTRIGDVIGIAKEIVALGEGIYTLVQKGRPTSNIEYAPIHVLPKDPLTKEAIDPFDLELVQDPVVKKYVVEIRNKKDKILLKFKFLLTFEPGGSFNGKGKYILNALIIPAAKINYGHDFNAKMKLQGISNKGTKKDPVAAATLTLSYSIGSVATSISDVTLITINGLGKVVIQ